MKHLLRLGAVLVLALALTPAMSPQGQGTTGRHTPPQEAGPSLPDKDEQDAILKSDHARDLKDAGQLVELAHQLKEELEKNDRRVLSLSSLKKTEEIEKLAKRIHSRLVH